ncbi:zinc finger and SCAN domain-containing protein 10-like [Ctenocephalides felis]|uniref:zinc finger and SCAN domain-containing protein 10-like n=1 Tax=Ctenocephalides felis TaxID=7515 RepID=UPI000E6E16DB|nr:zinc finger and SCAN domain-containing protein 10-like [Ctenocephalides felis]
MYENITQVKILMNENLPCNICTKCREELIKHFNFKEKCLNNEQSLKDYLKESTSQSPLSQHQTNPDVDSILELNLDDASKHSVAFSLNNESERIKDTRANPKPRMHSLQRNFHSFSKLLLHTEAHPTDKSVQCIKCPKRFESYKGLVRHLKNHDGSPFLVTVAAKHF